MRATLLRKHLTDRVAILIAAALGFAVAALITYATPIAVFRGAPTCGVGSPPPVCPNTIEIVGIVYDWWAGTYVGVAVFVAALLLWFVSRRAVARRRSMARPTLAAPAGR